MGLDNYDDSLPDGIPSWKGFLETVEGTLAALLAENAVAVERVKEEQKVAFQTRLKDDVDAAIRAALEAVRGELADAHFPFLSEADNADFIASLQAASQEYELSRL